ncbi:Large ribosomal subunit protein mL40 [Caenorhabditis elegans]|uniref:Large ribosomal subunit protein mL40 n=1 Tax=Caenorhabditis elegans TaxID=6239 RepID=Q9TZ90_CAEEL|nr:Large ribosomal subunit protein mL40 [Caenorhabditis elegans]CCD66086.1 Large ribosomal subunit protein mL40 [Caenorhabditis elegans]|eukprot:NP_497138.1 Mitochondrial Ribosomal Protein, Large [Caenorhabditis elegans]
MSSSLLASLSRLSLLQTRQIHQTIPAGSSVFMKRQKKIDPEVAKQRETRRRKRLEKDIRQMQKHSKKPKPVDELTLDVKSAKNIGERRRPRTELTLEQIDERAIALKDYTRSRLALQQEDDAWIRGAIESQRKALNELKMLKLELYEAAVQPAAKDLPLIVQGPSLTPPIRNYEAPDGDYIDTTRNWAS